MIVPIPRSGLTNLFRTVVINFTKKVMDIQTRKLSFIQELIKIADLSLLEKFEELIKQERQNIVEKEIKAMTIDEFEHRILNALEDVKNNRIKHARTLKAEIATWK
jgi:ABC-type hemin transport system ATPase subunit